jgi:hypothetical protein
MDQINAIADIREVIIEARAALVEAMINDPNSQIHWIDFTPSVIRRIDAAIQACDSLSAKSSR